MDHSGFWIKQFGSLLPFNGGVIESAHDDENTTYHASTTKGGGRKGQDVCKHKFS
jgi:hypothetical protein